MLDWAQSQFGPNGGKKTRSLKRQSVSVQPTYDGNLSQNMFSYYSPMQTFNFVSWTVTA
jgi:hypothetical protein